MKLSVPLLVATLGLALPAYGQGQPGAAAPPANPGAGVLTQMPAGVVSGPMSAPDAGAVNDYPTDARAEYVFACMAVNGQNVDVLRRCSCSIDVIASILTYDEYVGAEAVLSILQTTGGRVEIMRSSPTARKSVEDLRRAQAEGSVRCF